MGESDKKKKYMEKGKIKNKEGGWRSRRKNIYIWKREEKGR